MHQRKGSKLIMVFLIVRIEGIEGTAKPPNRPEPLFGGLELPLDPAPLSVPNLDRCSTRQFAQLSGDAAARGTREPVRAVARVAGGSWLSVCGCDASLGAAGARSREPAGPLVHRENLTVCDEVATIWRGPA